MNGEFPAAARSHFDALAQCEAAHARELIELRNQSQQQQFGARLHRLGHGEGSHLQPLIFLRCFRPSLEPIQTTGSRRVKEQRAQDYGMY